MSGGRLNAGKQLLSSDMETCSVAPGFIYDCCGRRAGLLETVSG